MMVYYAFNPATGDWVLKNNFTSPTAVLEAIHKQGLEGYVSMQVTIQDHNWRFIKTAIDNANNNAEVAYHQQQAMVSQPTLSEVGAEAIRNATASLAAATKAAQDDLLLAEQQNILAELASVAATLSTYQVEVDKLDAAINAIPTGPMAGENSNITALTAKKVKFLQEIDGLTQRQGYLTAQYNDIASKLPPAPTVATTVSPAVAAIAAKNATK